MVVRHEPDSEMREDTTICSLPESCTGGRVQWRVWHSETGPAYNSGRVQGWYLGDVEILVMGDT